MLLLVFADVALLGAGFGVGWLLDGVAESRPLLTLFGFVVGLTVAVVMTWSRVRRLRGSADA
jgi:F0F1-type ATP synthase assembly protein I